MDLKNIIPKELLTSKIIPKEIAAYVNYTVNSRLLQYDKIETNQENKFNSSMSNKDKLNKVLQDRLSRQKKNVNHDLLNNNIVSILKTQVKASIKLFQEVDIIKKKIEIHSAQIEDLIRTKGESALTDKQLELLISEKIKVLQADIEANHKINPKDNILDRTEKKSEVTSNNKPLVEEKKKGNGILDMLNNFGSTGFKAIAAMLLASLGPIGLALPALLLLAPLAPYVSTMFKMVKWFIKMGFGTLNKINDFVRKPLERKLNPNKKRKLKKNSIKRKLKKLNIAARRKVKSLASKVGATTLKRVATAITSKEVIKSVANKGMDVLSKVTSSAGSTIAKVGESISSFGSSAWGAIKSKSSGIYDAVKAMSNRLLPFFSRMSGNPTLRNEFIKRLGARIGVSRVATFMGKLAISSTGVGAVMLLWALYDVYDVSKEIYETVNELNGSEYNSSSTTTTKYTSSDTATYMGKDTSYAQEYNAGYSDDYVKSYTVQKQAYNPFNANTYSSTSGAVKQGSPFSKQVKNSNPSYMSYGTANTTNPSLIALVKSNEGFRPGYYPDAHGYSIGYGHFAKGKGSVPVAQILGYEPPNGIITRDEAEILLQYDLAKAKQGAYSVYPWLVKQPQLVQNHIIDMTYNLGVGGIQSFAPTMAHIEKGEYYIAANRLARTKWYSQVGTRSQRIVNDLRQLTIDNIDNIKKIEENVINGTDNKENNTTLNVNTSDKNTSTSNESTTIKPNNNLVNTLNNQPSNSDSDTNMDVNSYINDIGNDSKVKKLFNNVDTSPSGTSPSGTSESTTIKPNNNLVNTLNNQPSNSDINRAPASNGKVEVVKPTSTLESNKISKEDEEFFKFDTSYSTVKKPSSTFLNIIKENNAPVSSDTINNSSANNTFNNTSTLLMNNEKQASIPMIYKSSFS